MKILHLGNLKTGVDVCVRNILAFASDDFDFVVVNGADDRNRPYTRHGREVKAYKICMYRALNPLRDTWAVVQAIRIILKEKPDIVHCHSAKGGVVGRIAAFLTGRRSVYTPHAFSFLSAETGGKRKTYLWFEKLARLNSYLIGCSESERLLGIQQVGYPVSKAFAWNNAIPDIKPEEVVPPKDFKDTDKYIVTVARPSYQKNTLLMVEVMRLVNLRRPDLKLIVVGAEFYSPLLDEMKALIREYHLEHVVAILPWVSHAEALGYIKYAQLYLSTSIYEGLPIAVLEAMALGKAIVASDVIGNRDCVVDSINGYLLALEPQLFSEKICYLTEHEDVKNEMGQKSHRLFESQFMIGNKIAGLEEIYKKMCVT